MTQIERPKDDKAFAHNLHRTVNALIELKDPRYNLGNQIERTLQMQAHKLFAVLPHDVAKVTIAGVTLENPMLTYDKRKPDEQKEKLQFLREHGLPTKLWNVADINAYGHSFDSREYKWTDVEDISSK